MSRQPSCGLTEAEKRARIARMYLDVAEIAAAEEGDEARNVAAGNAVLAGIGASDAICCAPRSAPTRSGPPRSCEHAANGPSGRAAARW